MCNFPAPVIEKLEKHRRQSAFTSIFGAVNDEALQKLNKLQMHPMLRFALGHDRLVGTGGHVGDKFIDVFS